MEESPAESDGDDDVANLLADAGIFTSYAEIMCRPLPPNGHVRAIPISPLLSPTHMSVAVSVLRVLLASYSVFRAMSWLHAWLREQNFQTFAR